MSNTPSALTLGGGWRNHLVGFVFMSIGAPSALFSVVLMNELSTAPEQRDVAQGTTIEIKQPKPKPKQQVKKPRPKPKPKPRTPPPPSLAALASGMSGIEFDIPGLAFEDLGAANAGLLASGEEVVHTSDTVDNPPQPVQQVPPEFPRRLRDSGVEGYVTLSVLVNEVGGIERIKILESKPPGAFDDVAKEAIRQWRFQPGSYQGQPVKVWANQTIRFPAEKVVMTLRRLALVFLVAALGWVGVPAQAADDPEPEVDYVELATVLVQDGNYERASRVLAQVNPEEKGVDAPRYFLLRGLVRLNLSLFSQAAEDLNEAIKRGKAAAEADKDVTFDAVWYVYLGQAHFYAESFEAALDAFENAGARGEEIPSTFPLRSEALRKLKRYDDAWAVLGKGMKVHPNYTELIRRRAFLAIELQLYRAAAQLGRLYLERSKATAEDYLAIGAALNRAGSGDDALRFLELARLRFPRSPLVAAELGKLYQNRGLYRTAALMLERASLNGSDDLAIDAGELYRQAGEQFRALAMNSRVSDNNKRLRQRLGILLELRNFELVALMDSDLRRVGLLKDESLKYALAYAHFKVGNYARADKLLSGLRDPAIFRQATELRKAMSDCTGEPWRC